MSSLVMHGDASALPLGDSTIDAIVCDPPYGLEFMGVAWDTMRDGGSARASNEWGDFGSREHPRDATETGHVMAKKARAFGQWCETWTGEMLRVAKPGAHLIAFGAARTHHRLHLAAEEAGWEIRDTGVWLYRNGFPKVRTALKPALETWLIARKPCSERSVAANVERWGTGFLNIEGCRIPFADGEDEREAKEKNRHADFGSGPRENAVYGVDNRDRGENGNYDPEGRHPANVVTLEPDWDLRMFRLAVGLTADFAKAGSDERPWDARAGRGPRQTATGSPAEPGQFGGNVEAQHPTVKPLALLRHLVRLACPPGGVVLDPFLGSGTTVEAATLEGFRCIGVELNANYLPLVQRRMSKPLQPSLLGGVA